MSLKKPTNLIRQISKIKKKYLESFFLAYGGSAKRSRWRKTRWRRGGRGGKK
jgi:hypothetical protein